MSWRSGVTSVARLATITVLALCVAACYVDLPFPGGGRGYILTAMNETPDERVVFATEPTGDRYYLVPPGSEAVVDGVGEGNPPTDFVVVLDGICTEIDRIDADFSRGGIITMTAEGTDFTPEQRGPGDDRPGSFSTCEEALAQGR
jgi:hypothetical protein